jgi:DNA-binding MarR family transcriptional regulator
VAVSDGRQRVPDDLSGLDEAWHDFLAALRESRQPRRDLEGLSLAQYRVLAPLVQHRSLRVGQLAEEACIRGPTATRILDGLTRSALVRRQHSQRDRREVRISLTPEGRAAVAAKLERMEQARRQTFEQLSPEEREHATRFLGLMSNVIGRL